MVNEPKFSLKSIIYPNIYFEFNPTLPRESIFNLKPPLNFTIDMNGEIIIKNKDIFCSLYSKVKTGNSEFDDILRMQVIVTGFFQADIDMDDELIKRFSINFYSILFPFLRHATNDVMLKNGIHFIMPIMNIANIIKDNEACFVIKRI
ncbi:MAG: hypothetical protein WHV26_03565 [Spirochaetota bacterium]|jgi:preprotein translocase subunit SecB